MCNDRVALLCFAHNGTRSILARHFHHLCELHRIQIHFATLKITVQNGLLTFEQYQ